ncbi:class E sortase [Clavibacter nebraskensis]|uniref:Class E sortase n=2 Tax=Clavibacter nebraskensis TaxID=31963 RepID=A0A399QN76_9MICO|nr:class E sortase [Clavibacter nebraskensis]KXU19411.1 sortase [Clavibacter nebraskensis]OAH19790.1 class E sortase [Clavibacter nebraskensis]QGV65410.1 class E sortase [Clavibacter nebraskensis]QGV68207.1 class E sortase [Clavibacter nebraskensis]QGV71000.1 class E sortase [Clavibacter nebraskensis]
MSAPGPAPSRRATRRRGRRGDALLGTVGVLGELLLTAGVLIMLFLGWQLWFNDIVVSSGQRDQALENSRSWATAAPEAAATPDPAASPAAPGEPVITTAPTTDATDFGNIYIPRFGPDYVVPVATGVGLSSVLNHGKIGHYRETQMPGEVGNFAVAAHRTSYGKPFNQITDLRVGDAIVVETQDGWYTYRFRTLEYVKPTGVDVLDEVPQAPDAQPGDRILTMTSCNPLFSAAERVIAYSVFESWQPRSDAATPAALAGTSFAKAG